MFLLIFNYQSRGAIRLRRAKSEARRASQGHLTYTDYLVVMVQKGAEHGEETSPFSSLQFDLLRIIRLLTFGYTMLVVPVLLLVRLY